MASREEFLKRLRETFRIEASEGIAHITTNLIELEKELPESRQSELIESIFRDAHSLKGAARAVSFSEIETLCQALESVFSALKSKDLGLNTKLFDLFHQSINLLNSLLNLSYGEMDETVVGQLSVLIEQLRNLETTDNESIATKSAVIEKIIPDSKAEEVDVLISDAEEKTSESAPLVEEKKEPAKVTKQESTVRISIDKLDNLLNQAEEFLTLKQNFSHINQGLSALNQKIELLNYELTGVSPLANNRKQNENQLQKNDTLLANYLDWSASLIQTLRSDLEKIRKRAENESYNSGLKVEGLLNEVRKIISVPFSNVLDGFPKAARDLAKDSGKKVKVEVSGSEMEIDRRILDELHHPLIHLLRNSIDHGIEKPEERLQKQKSAIGVIQISVERMENNRVTITFEDDGAGVDLGKVKRRYIKQENVPEHDWGSIDENTLLKYLFRSGFSTSELITDISGRGLGLSIVQEKIEQLGGSITIKTEQNIGTTFKIEVPLSLVTFRGVNVQVGEREFVIPTSKIEKAIRVEKLEIKTIENKKTIAYNHNIIPLVFLSDILEIPWKESEENKLMVIVLNANDNRVGFVVDSILDEEVIVSKKFNNQMKRVRNISGATVLGSGKVVPILNVSDLLKSAVKSSVIRIQQVQVEKEKNSILVVEDSITSRMLLKNILETAGYKVATAIDGIEGYTKLKETPVDIVISDVDMPRMNGFDMTAKIRADKALSEIPVVLVTSLSKREDRERGLEVGANGYIVKSNFDQSNLLEVIGRLIG
jgi:two-component system chemotaxis sensor kinase CheA